MGCDAAHRLVITMESKGLRLIEIVPAGKVDAPPQIHVLKEHEEGFVEAI